MVTIDGAKVLQRDDDLGSLEVGKKADLVLIDYARKPHLNPLGEDIYSAVAFGARGSDVGLVMVDGRVVVEDGEIVTVDTAEVIRMATAQSEAYRERIAKMPISPEWELPTL
jgi:5-methylthioadenosine/S-adenosylhomocysteine deaminase